MNGLRRLPRVPLLLTAGLLLGAAVPASPIREVVRGEGVEGVRLVVPGTYLPLAPLLNVWDHLTVLALSQHIAFILSLLLIFLGWRVFRHRTPRNAWRRVGIEFSVAAGALASLLLFDLAAVLLHRPMASLVVDDPDTLVIDFHAHTDRSHDGRAGFDSERVREWHAASGFHAVLVTDHYTWQGFADGVDRNPVLSGDGVVLLEGAELKLFGLHTNVLGDSLRYRPWVDDTGRNLRAEPLEEAIRAGRIPPPTFLMPLPVPLDGLEGYSADTPLGLVAIEINDSSPKGMQQSLGERARILRMADSLNLALVAGSNHHGWGRTAAAWTLMRIPGWRTLTPPQLLVRVEEELHTRRRAATVVVERAVPWHGESRLALVLTVPRLAWQMARSLSVGERVSWLAWIWGGALVVHRVRQRGHPAPSAPGPRSLSLPGAAVVHRSPESSGGA